MLFEQSGKLEQDVSTRLRAELFPLWKCILCSGDRSIDVGLVGNRDVVGYEGLILRALHGQCIAALGGNIFVVDEQLFWKVLR